MDSIALTPPVFHALLCCQRFCLTLPGPSGAFLSANGHLPALSLAAVLGPAPPYSLGAALRTPALPAASRQCEQQGNRGFCAALALKVSSFRLPKRQQ